MRMPHEPRPVRRAFIIALAALAASALLAAPAPAGNVDLPRFPSISPDGETIVFSWRGDLWKASIDGGEALRLTSHPAEDTRTAWSRDGQRIAFNSDRDGYGNIYVMNADGSGIAQVTNLDRDCDLVGWGADEHGHQVITFDAVVEPDVYRERRPYMIRPEGGEMRRAHQAFGSHPVISADGPRIAFSRGGYYYGWARRHGRGPETQDVWLYDRSDDSFTQLTEWDGNDGRARWGGEHTLIFMSDRELDTVNLYRMSARDGEETAVRLTDFDDLDIVGFDVSADGDTAIVHVWDALYRVDLADPNAEAQRLDLHAAEDERDNEQVKSINREVSETALSPDGKVLAYVAYGDLFVRHVDDKSPTRQVTQGEARERSIAWSPDGLRLYFQSDRDGTESIYAATVALSRSEVKEQFRDRTGRPDDDEQPDDDAEAAQADDEPASPAAGTWRGTVDIDGETVAFILRLEAGDEEAGELTGSMDVTSRVRKGPFIIGEDTFTLTGVTGEYDSDTSALTVTAPVADDAEVRIEATIDVAEMTGRWITAEHTADFTATRDEPVDESGDDADDEKKDEDLPKQLDPSRWHDAITFTIEPVVQTAHNDRDPRPAPDGRQLSFKRSRGDIIVRDLATGDERTIIEGWDWWIDWQWSPDSRFLAYAQANMNFNSDVFIVPVDSSAEPVNLTRHPDNDEAPRWSADGKILSFISERINEQYDVFAVYLDPALEAYTPKELDTYYEDAAKKAKQRTPLDPKSVADILGVEFGDDDTGEQDQDGESDEDGDGKTSPIDEDWELDTAYLRLRRLTSLPENETGLLMTPGGDRYIFNGSADQPGLYSVKWDGSERKRLSGRANAHHVSLDGSLVVFTDGGRGGTVQAAGGDRTIYDISDDIRIDLQQQASQKFHEAMRVLGEMFYHPDMKGMDWDALTDRYHDLALRTRTAGEFNHVANRMLGELSASHTGVRSANGYNSPNRVAHGRLGLEYEHTGEGFRITHIIDESPAAKGTMALQVGDVITAINGDDVTEDDALLAMLEGLVGEETLITIERSVDEGAEPFELHVLLTPTSYWSLRQLAYEHWRRETARKVDEMSDGRIGYIHVQAMGQAALDVFERDLFAAAYGKDGLIIDVRNNGGGWTTDRLLSSIMTEPHAYTVPRGAEHVVGFYPQDRLFIQRYSLPINALCNEKSFSNAEIFSHAFKNLGRGTLVGQETWGGVISTGGFSLIDGTTVRLPFRGWYVMDGTDMENAGAVPDILIPQTPDAEAADRDEQLEAAVDDLLKRLD